MGRPSLFTAEERLGILAEWERSNLPAPDFCRLHAGAYPGLRGQWLHQWRWKYRVRGLPASDGQNARRVAHIRLSPEQAAYIQRMVGLTGFRFDEVVGHLIDYCMERKPLERKRKSV